MIYTLNGINFVYGLVFNSLTVVICTRKRLRQIATFIILAFAAISNGFGLFGYPLHSFLDNLLGINIKHSSSVWCKLVVTLTAFTFEWTIWLLALASLEMYLTLKIENFRLRFSNTRNTVAVCLVLGLVFILFNFPSRLLKSFEPTMPKNRSLNNICADTRIDEDLILFYTKAHRFSFVIVPILLMIVCNCLMVYELKRHTKAYSPESVIKDDLKNMTKTLILISINFTAILLVRWVLTLAYSLSPTSRWLFSSIEWVDLAYSVYLNSIFFLLTTRNELFSEEFKNFYMRQHSNELTHI